MFKKLKDKLAEEVKSSPQRIQQFAQAAQAAVTSASSSISDITNNDLFSIGDNESQSAKTQTSLSSQQSTFQDVPRGQPTLQTGTDALDVARNPDIVENQRQRRLSNSSFSSDVSFRLPSYESPSMYHLQSDMEVSASEADERGFSSGVASLDRVTKEQIYAAYRRTQERYTKYRTQYADLARHYKLLERENAKARSVLVETQDKALRRISELREQCTLEQSAKAHLEKALRIEIEERNLKIDALNTKIELLQSNIPHKDSDVNLNQSESIHEAQLINLSVDNDNKHSNDDENSASEVIALNNKIEKLEQLISKYKDSLKTVKEKNGQLTTELQIVSNEVESKNKENEGFKLTELQLNEAKQRIQELNDLNEELQNKINTSDFMKSKEISTLEIDIQKSHEEIAELRSKIQVFTKREEEYAISLAENKLSIHKELESKENEIKSLKDNLSASKKEIQSLNIVISDYKNNISLLEEERSKLTKDIHELNLIKSKANDLESQIQEIKQQCQHLENAKSKADEEYKCLQLQLKQETAEKLAMIDRNGYLENRNTQLSEENIKKSSEIRNLDSELQILKEYKENNTNTLEAENITVWKNKCSDLEAEIQEEREELVKLQTEIEKLLANHNLIQIQNTELNNLLSDLKAENTELLEKVANSNKVETVCENLMHKVKDLQQFISLTSLETKTLKNTNNDMIDDLKQNINNKLLMTVSQQNELDSVKYAYKELKQKHCGLQKELTEISARHEYRLQELNSLQTENCELKSQIHDNELEKSHMNEKIENINGEHKITLHELNCKIDENKQLLEIYNETEKRCQHLEATIATDNDRYMTVFDKATVLEDQNQNLLDKLKTVENEYTVLITEVDKLRNEHKDAVDKTMALKTENENLIMKTKDCDDKNVIIANLEENIKVVTKENISLRTQSERIANNVKDLEIELSDVRKSHAKIEIEKDRLNSIMDKLEKNENKHVDTVSKDIQTDECNHEANVHNADVEYKTNIKEVNEKLLQPNINDVVDLTSHNELKEENRRLQSDIAGLQSYLAKISKENSILNDKLRELIASGENASDKNDILTRDFSDSKNEMHSQSGKINDLIRENTLLVEENLELKDQLNSQTYIKSTEIEQLQDRNKEMEHNDLKDKYSTLLAAKQKLEKRLIDVDLMNKSVNDNLIQTQDNNEKLRLSNDKMERRLDEALVSLRHLHSLQENTELEYLRNILFEYLTGSGTHSLTLAKVLSAVVKFDDMQTQQVLHKEKERQGLLRQLGLL